MCLIIIQLACLKEPTFVKFGFWHDARMINAFLYLYSLTSIYYFVADSNLLQKLYNGLQNPFLRKKPIMKSCKNHNIFIMYKKRSIRRLRGSFRLLRFIVYSSTDRVQPAPLVFLPSTMFTHS